jgi:hypothetical protein
MIWRFLSKGQYFKANFSSTYFFIYFSGIFSSYATHFMYKNLKFLIAWTIKIKRMASSKLLFSIIVGVLCSLNVYGQNQLEFPCSNVSSNFTLDVILRFTNIYTNITRDLGFFNATTALNQRDQISNIYLQNVRLRFPFNSFWYRYF